MKGLRKKVFVTAGYNTIFFGPGRKEFNPKKPMPKYEEYLKEAAQGTCSQLPNPDFDEGVIGNFLAGRFLRQGNIPGFLPYVVPNLLHKPCVRTEGACGSGGVALTTAIRSILSDQADSVFVMGFEVQNTVKAVYGADYLAGADYISGKRKEGHAYYFPDQFSKRAGAYGEKFGKDKTRRGMAKWYELSVSHARKNPKAQEYHNQVEDLFALGMTPPDPKIFLEHLNQFDCSKVSDGASSLVFLSEEGLDKVGVKKEDCVEIIGFAQCQADITRPPEDNTFMPTIAAAGKGALETAGVARDEISVLELHDCFSITSMITLESIGFAERGKGADFLLDEKTTIDGILPVNPSGGLCGFGHPTGATGVRQLCELYFQLTGQADNQVQLKQPYGMMINMGGNDVTVVSIIVKKAA
ncbi:3-ketoacyl-CoA thiolase [Planctomycetota bacterium]